MRAGLPRRLPALRRASGARERSAMSQCRLQRPRGRAVGLTRSIRKPFNPD